MRQRKLPYEDKFERKAKAQDRAEFHKKKQNQSTKYYVEIDDEDDTANLAVLAFNSKLKRK